MSNDNPFDGAIYKLHIPGKGWRALKLDQDHEDDTNIIGHCEIVFPSTSQFKQEKFWKFRKDNGVMQLYSSPAVDAKPLMTLDPAKIECEWEGKTHDRKPARFKMHHGDFLARQVKETLNGRPDDHIVEGAELGVHQGFMSRVLLDRIPNLELHMVDLWGVHPDDSEFVKSGDLRSKHGWKDYNDNLLLARRRVRAYTWHAHVHITSTHMASELFEDNSLDFVFIDGDHSYDGCFEDMVDWYPKVREGGIFSGHDYDYHPEGMDIQVTQAVDKFTEDNNLPFKVGPSCVWWMVK